MSTGGRWSLQESTHHINCLELLAGSLAVKCFTKSKAKAQVLLLMDNVTAVTYINNMGGTHSRLLSQLAKNLWDWCLSHNVLLSAQYIPGIQNIQADRPRVEGIPRLQRLETEPNCFQQPVSEMGTSRHRLTFQFDHYVSWRPDPSAIHTDAFTLNWTTFRGYAFPPFAMIGRCLQLIQSQKVEHLVLMAPVWPTQAWYPLLLELCIYFPLLLPTREDLLIQRGKNHPLHQLQLAGWWLLSTVATKQQEFLNKLEKFSWQPGEETPLAPIPQPGTSGVAGVLKGSLSIPFHHL